MKMIPLLILSFGLSLCATTAKDFLKKKTWESVRTSKKLSTVKVESLDVVRRSLWKKYKKSLAKDASRLAEHKNQGLKYNGKTMKFSKDVIGKKPKNGYPLYITLHGGGSGSPAMNDGQWNHMKVYYKGAVKSGVYLAARGVTNTWNLHFVNESYIFYDRLIENMIAYENVDPNRVYILGFSAGGDGVYQIAPRMADRWAAANMSAGHHNGVSPRNLYNLPFIAQVGEFDTRFKRHQEAVKFIQKIQGFQEQEKGRGYTHQVNVHTGRGHNFPDNDPRMKKYTVIENPLQWLEGEKATAENKNTNGIAWVNQYRRKALPSRVIWDVKTRANRSAEELWKSSSHGKQHYWLAVDEFPEGEIIARLSKKYNRFTVEKADGDFLLRLSSKKVNFKKPVVVKIAGKKFKITVKPKLETMVKTLVERGDPEYIFEAEIQLTQDGASWTAKQL